MHKIIAALSENKQRCKVARIPNQWSGTKRTAETSPLRYGKNVPEARLSLQKKFIQYPRYKKSEPVWEVPRLWFRFQTIVECYRNIHIDCFMKGFLRYITVQAATT